MYSCLVNSRLYLLSDEEFIVVCVYTVNILDRHRNDICYGMKRCKDISYISVCWQSGDDRIEVRHYFKSNT